MRNETEFEFEFFIPRNNKELLDGNGSAYFVQRIFDANEIPTKLKQANQALQTADVFSVVDHFDTFFSVIENASKLPMNNLFRALDILYNSSKKYAETTSLYLKQSDNNRPKPYQTLTKMTLYLLVATVRAIDDVIKAENADAAAKKGRKQMIDHTDQRWEEHRYDVMMQVFHIIQLPLEKLWNMAIPDETFVNMFCNLAYCTLTNPFIREKRIADATFHIFGVAIKQYNHAMAFPVRIMQILLSEDMAVTPVAHGIKLLAEQYNITTVFSMLMGEFIERLNVPNPDATASKNFSQFLLDSATICPGLVTPPLSDKSEELLNLEPYGIRNSVLSIMGQIIMRDLTAETLEDEQKELRDEFLENLLNHMEDVSSYVRSKVLHIWNEMKVEGAVPLAWLIKILRLTVERLEDRTATVRKNAVTLLKAFLETNPFSSKLSLQELEAKLQEEEANLDVIKQKVQDQMKHRAEVIEKFQEEYKPKLLPFLQDLLKQDAEEQIVPNDESQTDTENAVVQVRDLIKSEAFEEVAKLIIPLDACNREKRMLLPIHEQCEYFLFLLNSYLFEDYNYEYDVKALQVGFLSDSVAFSKIITQAVPKIEMLLMSVTNSDVYEAIDFFTTGYLFNIKGTESGMRRMLCLVWTNDKDKRAAVTNAYNRVLFQTNAKGRAHHLKVVDNLFRFFENVTVGEYGALELMMKEWIETNVIDAQIIQVFFERFTKKIPDTTDNLGRCCQQFLILASAAKPSIVTSNVDLITNICVGERGQMDPRIFSGCLELLMNSVQPGTGFYQRAGKTETLDGILRIFKRFFFFPRCDDFECVGSRVVRYIYQMCQEPDIICQELIVDLCTKLTEISDKHNERLTQLSASDMNPTQTIDEFHIPEYLLARLICVVGLIASREMMFLDIDVYNNMKYRDDLKREKKDQQKKKTTNNNSKRKTLSNTLNQSASDVLKRLSTVAEPQQEEEMLVGATAEDNIAELINQICENELICSSEGLLTNFIPVVTEILNQPGKHKNPHVQQAACLTLIRFMSVSSIVCSDNMPFLMNILDKTANNKIKCNIIIGLSDFTCRFPNVMEPWTTNLYSTLLETDDTVRLAAVKMLSHLILQEMIRVRGQLSDMAVCIVDENEEIRQVTKEFFKAIKDKSNILYNVLPDIISRLSSVDNQLQEDKFRTIMQNIMGLIEKDRQIESLVEKLCLRFKITSVERQWRDIAYCLSLLRHTEKTLKKLIDNITHFKDKIQNDDVMECFKTIITNANKNMKPEMKAVSKELDIKLQECLMIGDNKPTDANTSRAAEGSPVPAGKGQKKRGQKIDVRRRNARRGQSSSEDSDFDSPASPAPAGRMARVGRKVTKNVVETESDEEEDEQPARTRRRRK